MIVASHQPNFMPYMGYFYKMYMCDVFTISDTVQFSRQGFQNFNFFDMECTRSKITVPVSSHSKPIKDTELHQWEHNRKKIWKRLCQNYSKAPYFEKFSPVFKQIFEKDYSNLAELNIALIKAFYDIFGLDCEIIFESDLDIDLVSTPTAQIAEICIKTGCDTYLTGMGAMSYLDEQWIEHKGGKVVWSNYKPLPYGNHENLSAFDYIMHKGAELPEEWKKEKEALRRG